MQDMLSAVRKFMAAVLDVERCQTFLPRFVQSEKQLSVADLLSKVCNLERHARISTVDSVVSVATGLKARTVSNTLRALAKNRWQPIKRKGRIGRLPKSTGEEAPPETSPCFVQQASEVQEASMDWENLPNVEAVAQVSVAPPSGGVVSKDVTSVGILGKPLVEDILCRRTKGWHRQPGEGELLVVNDTTDKVHALCPPRQARPRACTAI